MLKIEEETTMLEDLDFEPMCRRKNCGEAAQWVGIGNCCGHALYHCDEHRADFINNMMLAAIEGIGWMHLTCGKDTTDVEWHRL